MSKEIVESVRLLKWTDAKMEENLEMRLAGAIWNQAIDEAIGVLNMYKPEVVIKSISGSSKWRDRIEKTGVYVNSDPIGEYSYGGEPEDNSRSRDYKWVESLLKNLAESLGAKVTVEKEDRGERNDW